MQESLVASNMSAVNEGGRDTTTTQFEIEDNHPDELEVSDIPPADSGRKAYAFLFGGFMIEAILWGFPLAFGVFQNYYAKVPEFHGSTSIPIIGTVATGIQFLGAPFVTPFATRYRQWQRLMVIVGCTICMLAALIASFMQSVAGLIATQGVLYGIGFTIMYLPMLCMLNEWFVRRRGFAYGILFAGGGFSGLGLPFLFEWLLDRYGHRTTLRVIAAMQLLTVGPVLPLLKPRMRSSQHTASRATDLSFFRKPLFWILSISNLCQSFAYYVPSLYLPTYASAIGLSGTLGALVLAVNNLASIAGMIGFGHASDRYSNIFVLILISTATSSLSAFLLWGYARSFAVLIIFSFVYGCFTGGYVVFWPKFGSILSEDPQSVYSLMAFGKGIGSIVTGPVSSRLLTGTIGSGYGLGKFEPLILYSGTFMLCSSFGAVGRFLAPHSRAE